MSIGIDEEGKKVSIVTSKTGFDRLWIVDMATQLPVEVARHYSINSSSLSSAANLIAYSYREGKGQRWTIRVVNLTNGSHEEIGDATLHYLHPSLSADGRLLAYATSGERTDAWGGRPPTDYRLFLLDRTTGSKSVLDGQPSKEMWFPCIDQESEIVTYFRQRFIPGEPETANEMCAYDLKTGAISVHRIRAPSRGGRWLNSKWFYEAYAKGEYTDAIVVWEREHSITTTIYKSGIQFDSIAWSSGARKVVGLEKQSGRLIRLHMVDLDTGETAYVTIKMPESD